MTPPIRYTSIIIAALAILCGITSSEAAQIRVSCVADSNTAGYALADPGKQSSPARLQTLLGSSYLVGNCGNSGTTVEKVSDYPYWNSRAYNAGTNSVPKTARDLTRDATFGWHTCNWARLQSQAGKSTVFYYYFDQHPDYPGESPKAGYGSPHAQDVSYVFLHLNPNRPETTKSELAISNAMSTCWVNVIDAYFARRRTPEGEAFVNLWKPTI
jgi:hypothetical protein